MSHDQQHWSAWVREYETQNEPYVIVTILGAKGSTPRASGTKMVVSKSAFHGTIGGGTLEFSALQKAQTLLEEGCTAQQIENYPLGEKLGQCCGGSTTLLFECFTPIVDSLYLFGAGHVGRALAPILAALPLRVRWIDSRPQEFPAAIPDGVSVEHTDEPCDWVSRAEGGAYYIIMTHQHPLDFALLEAVLKREDAAYVGVIGSHSKWRRFRMRLEHRGYADSLIESVRCPIGLPEVPGKRPSEIAVAVAGEVIAHYHARRDEQPAQAPGWKALQSQLEDTNIVTPAQVDTHE